MKLAAARRYQQDKSSDEESEGEANQTVQPADELAHEHEDEHEYTQETLSDDDAHSPVHDELDISSVHLSHHSPASKDMAASSFGYADASLAAFELEQMLEVCTDACMHVCMCSYSYSYGRYKFLVFSFSYPCAGIVHSCD